MSKFDEFLFGCVRDSINAGTDDDRPTPRPVSRATCGECGCKLGSNAVGCDNCWDYAMEHAE